MHKKTFSKGVDVKFEMVTALFMVLETFEGATLTKQHYNFDQK